MFHSTHTDNSITFPKNINITHKRAPTDDSIRILNEMREKILTDIRREFVLELDGVQIAEATSIKNVIGRKYTCTFKINNAFIDIHIPIKYILTAKKDDSLFKYLIDELSKKILLTCHATFSKIIHEELNV